MLAQERAPLAKLARYNRHQRRAIQKGLKMRLTFQKQQTFFPEWNGNLQLAEAERFSVKLKTLDFTDLLLIMEVINDAGDNKNNSDWIVKAINKLRDMFPKYAEVIGLIDGDGNSIDVNEVLASPIFIGLAGEIMMKLVNISMPSDTAEKN